MLTPSTRPSFKMSADNSEQKVMWIMVSAIGYGKPEYDSTNLLHGYRKSINAYIIF